MLSHISHFTVLYQAVFYVTAGFSEGRTSVEYERCLWERRRSRCRSFLTWLSNSGYTV